MPATQTPSGRKLQIVILARTLLPIQPREECSGCSKMSSDPSSDPLLSRSSEAPGGRAAEPAGGIGGRSTNPSRSSFDVYLGTYETWRELHVRHCVECVSLAVRPSLRLLGFELLAKTTYPVSISQKLAFVTGQDAEKPSPPWLSSAP